MKNYFNSGNLSLGEFTSLGLRYDFENAFISAGDGAIFELFNNASSLSAIN